MSEPGRAATVIFDELAVITPEMLEAGSKAALDLGRRGMERNDKRPLAADSELLTAVYLAMLRTALF